MNYLSNRPNYPFNDVNVPVGLEQILSDISREVLKVQPNTETIYDFIATYLEKNLNVRENIKAIENFLKRIINRAVDIAQDLRNEGLEKEKADKAAEIIQSCFEKFIAERRKESYSQYDINFEFNELNLILELMSKCKLTEVEILRTQPAIFAAYHKFILDYLTQMEDTIFPPEKIDSEMQNMIARCVGRKPKIEKLIKAANTIKAVFKGYIVRKAYRNCKVAI